MGRTGKIPLLDPSLDVVAHIASWFVELSNSRTYTVIAGMDSCTVLHNAIPCTELDAFARISGYMPSIFELNAIRAMDFAYISEKSAQGSKKGLSGDRYKAVGEYCNGEEVERCKKTFGAQLERICSTCPD